MRRIAIVLALAALTACKPQNRAEPGPVAAAPVDQAQPVYREIKDWLVGCDNQRHCRAKFVADLDTFRENMGEHSSARMVIEQQAGPDGRLTVTLAILGDEAAEKYRTHPDVFDPRKTLYLDGKPLTGVKADWSRAQDGPTFALSGDQALNFVRALKNASLLAFNEGPESPAVSLQGLAAVLLLIDETQGRLDNRTALARFGEGAPALVPAPPPMPVVQPAPATAALPNAAIFASAVRKARGADFKAHDCDADASGDAAYRLSASEGLVIAKCLQGAYQASYLVFTGPLDDAASSRLLKLSLPAAAGGVVEGLNPDDYAGEYGDAAFDPREATLSKIGRGRGLGDCGQSAKWAYDGAAFQLIEAKYQARCGDMADDWLVLYRAAIAKPN